jgi:predicted molibdopterin-dependent oxidoreductase YjgC
MEIFRHAETGQVRLMWIVGTNPAVSLPELHRVRKILAQENLFVVVQDAFLTETARLADVVLPAALWGEKTGTFTNADRTVHISHKAVEPPGEAKPDLDVFLDYARRMDFRDKDGGPLIKWDDPEGAFEAWKECSRGWPCDYSGLTYAKLSEGSGIQWPCNAEHPDGAERLYTNHVFRTHANLCETFGHDLGTGAAREEQEYKAHDPQGQAILKAADYHTPLEEPDKQYPFWLTTGRVVYHFHTRTKTGRSRELNAAAPDAFVQVATADAKRLGITAGDLVRVASRRGTIVAPAKVGGIEPGHVFIPFHYGYWDEEGGFEPDGRARAANELTLTAWDPISKQPYYKYAAVQVAKARRRSLKKRAADALGKAKDRASELADKALSAAHKERVRVPEYLGTLRAAHEEFATACETVAARYLEEIEVRSGLGKLAGFSRESVGLLRPLLKKYGEEKPDEPDRLRKALFPAARADAFGLLRDLHDLFLMATEVHVTLAIVLQAAQALRDPVLVNACEEMETKNELQKTLLLTQIKHRAPHALVIPF